MQERSKRMLEAGWVLQALSEKKWLATSPRNLLFYWEGNKWKPSEHEMIHELEQTENDILLGRYSPFVGTSRLTAPVDIKMPGLLTQWLIQQDQIKGHSILRVRVNLDPAGDEKLYEAGARRVETLLQPWPEAPDNQRHIPFHLLICEHVADVIPQKDRSVILPRLTSHLASEANAYFSFYQMDALPLTRPHHSFGDGYIFEHGLHKVFMKPSLPGLCAGGVQKLVGGFAEEVNVLYNEIFCRWSPYAG